MARPLPFALLALLALSGLGCQSASEAGGAAATAAPPSASPPGSGVPSPLASVARPTSSAEALAGIPVPEAEVAKVVNPLGATPYAGPTATLKGRVRIEGDPPPPRDFKYPDGCGEAAATYGKLFRVGQDGAAADVLVTVTGYEGFVPAKEPAVKTQIHGCAFSRRTIAMTFGQRLEVYNLDKSQTYMPYLDGQATRAAMVAVPMGDAVKLYPLRHGIFGLIDFLPKPFLDADVFVLKYATADVTDLDGTYEIGGIPVGKVRVDALLPAADVLAGQDLDLHPGENTADLVLRYVAKPASAPGATPSASPRVPDIR